MKQVFLAIVLVVLSINSITAQRLEYLNKYYFQVYDTSLYEYTYYKIIHEDSSGLKAQTYRKEDNSKYSQFTLLKGQNGENLAELTLRFYKSGKLKYHCKRDIIAEEETIKEFYENGNPKSEKNSKGDEIISERYFSESGEIISRSVIIEALPKGGMAGWNTYLAKTLRYPYEAQNSNIEGKVIIAFDLNEEGMILNPEVANPEQIHPSLAKEALRAVKNYKEVWTPFKIDGVAQSCEMKLPIMFKLTD